MFSKLNAFFAKFQVRPSFCNSPRVAVEVNALNGGSDAGVAAAGVVSQSSGPAAREAEKFRRPCLTPMFKLIVSFFSIFEIYKIAALLGFTFAPFKS